ncbi:hypothetical protein FE634_11895 [Nocardioides dongxiaopingii]|uniref:hypothetical protein n=1 Tax=Nocardioides sp. S-1144 TaxID=2582905 RepID=UPI0011649C80|nr:hypothetical protein [Nocardioides sp. S-1144]QCW50924.2 hypothetical protein FE634_11895 [Nocardioides sp. S-1144]
MDDVERVGDDPWVRGWLVGGGVLAAVTAISALPWPLWVGWAYLGVLCLLDANRHAGRAGDAEDDADRRPGRRARREVAHTAEDPGVWQTRADE